MGYKHTNSKGVDYYLHTSKGRGGTNLYFFSKKAEDNIDLPKGLEIFENPRTTLPMVKAKGKTVEFRKRGEAKKDVAKVEPAKPKEEKKAPY